jgi:hypothetical protein
VTATLDSFVEELAEAMRGHRQARLKLYYQNNRSYILSSAQANYTSHRLDTLAYQREYQAQNRQQIAVRESAHYAENRERILAQKKEYYAKNREQILEKYRERYLSAKLATDPKEETE